MPIRNNFRQKSVLFRAVLNHAFASLGDFWGKPASQNKLMAIVKNRNERTTVRVVSSKCNASNVF